MKEVREKIALGLNKKDSVLSVLLNVYFSFEVTPLYIVYPYFNLTLICNRLAMRLATVKRFCLVCCST